MLCIRHAVSLFQYPYFKTSPGEDLLSWCMCTGVLGGSGQTSGGQVILSIKRFCWPVPHLWHLLHY